MNLLLKHIVRLKNTLLRRYKILCFKLMYGGKFKYEKFHFRSGFHIYIEDDGKLKIGSNCFFNHNCSITSRKSIRIGKNCIFGENVKIYDHNHKFQDKSKEIYKQGFKSAEVVIEDDCWIASNVVILQGVHIGTHSVIGAGVIVYKDVLPNSVIVCEQNIVNIDSDNFRGYYE